MTKIVNASMPAQDNLYLYFVDRQDNGQFDRYNLDMQTFINHIWNKNLGVTVAMSHSGIGSDTTNGFIQFICDNPMMQLRLLARLTELRDAMPRAEQPVIEIRSKSTPSVKNPEWPEDITHYITVMLRTPRFRNKSEASAWWAKFAGLASPVAQAA